MILKTGAFVWLPGALEYAAAGHVRGGTARNSRHLAAHVVFASDVTVPERLLLSDPQTSGGLLVSIDAGSLDLSPSWRTSRPRVFSLMSLAESFHRTPKAAI